MPVNKKNNTAPKKNSKKTNTAIGVIAVAIILAAAVSIVIWSLGKKTDPKDDKPVIEVSDTVTEKAPENTNVVTMPPESDTVTADETSSDTDTTAPVETLPAPEDTAVTIEHSRSSASGELPDGYTVSLDVDAPKMSSDGYGENVTKFNSIVSTEVEELKNRYAQTLANPGENGGADMSYRMTFEVCKNDSGIVSILLKTDNDLGGAEEEYSYRAINFEMNGGKLLTLGDILAADKETYAPFVKSLILAEMRKDPQKYYSTDDNALDDVFDETHFYLTSKGVTVFFNEYDIAPSSEGVPTFELTYADLAPLMAY